MDNVTQKEHSPTALKSVKIPLDVWRVVRREAYETETSIAQVLARLVRERYPVQPVSGVTSTAA